MENKAEDDGGCWKRFRVLSSGPAILVLLGGLMAQIIFGGIIKSYGILYLGFLDLFGAGSARTSWIAFTYSIMLCTLAPVAGLVCDFVSSRSIVLSAAVLGCGALIGTAFCSTLTMVIFSYGALLGLSHRFAWMATVTFINRHFPNHRLLSNGFMFSGSSLGGICLPFLMTWLSSQYSIRGALILWAGLWLNLAVCANLLNRYFVGYFNTVSSSKILFEKTKGGNSELPKETQEILNKEIMNVDTTNQNIDGEQGVIRPTNTNIKYQKEQENIDAKDKHLNESLRAKAFKRLKALLNIQFVTTAILWYCVTNGTNVVPQFLPAYAKEHGWSSSDYSSFIAIMYACDLTSRMILSLIGDWDKINRSYLVSAMCITCGVYTLLFSFHTNDVTFYIYAVMHGFLGETTIVFMGFTVSESINKEYMGLGFGVISTMYGLSGMVGTAIVGHVQEYTNTYVCFLYLTGSLQIFGPIAYLMGHLNLSTCRQQEYTVTT